MPNEQEAVPEQKTKRRVQILQVVHPSLYDLLVTRLEEVQIHSYDVRFTVEEETTVVENEEVILKVAFGEWYQESFERVFAKAEFTVDSDEMQTYIVDLVKACEEALILDYRKFMQPHT